MSNLKQSKLAAVVIGLEGDFLQILVKAYSQLRRISVTYVKS